MYKWNLGTYLVSTDTEVHLLMFYNKGKHQNPISYIHTVNNFTVKIIISFY